VVLGKVLQTQTTAIEGDNKQYKPLFGASNTPSQTNQHSLKAEFDQTRNEHAKLASFFNVIVLSKPQVEKAIRQ